jgi:hypothetical protein
MTAAVSNRFKANGTARRHMLDLIFPPVNSTPFFKFFHHFVFWVTVAESSALPSLSREQPGLAVESTRLAGVLAEICLKQTVLS